MDWASFRTHGQAPTRAFEAFTGMLFERWVRHERSGSVDNVVFINGSGGDGGVEAVGYHGDSPYVGLQAKWFREPLDGSRIGQISDSLTTALKHYPQLKEYVVTVPRDLADLKREVKKGKTGKKGKKETTTERDRWDALVKTYQTSHPHLLLTLWDEQRLSTLLSTYGSNGLLQYWFDKTAFRFDSLTLRFKQAKSGWLGARYLPNLHSAGRIEQDLDDRINGLSLTPQLEAELARTNDALHAASREVARLRRFPFFMRKPDAEAVIVSTLAAIDSAREEQRALRALIEARSIEPARIPAATSLSTALHSLLRQIEPQNERGIDSTRSVRAVLEAAANNWSTRTVTPPSLRRLTLPSAYVGVPGSGKTHALADVVDRQLQQGRPALIVRARDIDARLTLESILRLSTGAESWSLEDILDALEAAATMSQVGATATLPSGARAVTTRFLLALDGLDESPNSEEWKDKLPELSTVAPRWPRVCFSVSMRESLWHRIGPTNLFASLYVDDSNPDIDEVFTKYTETNSITCPPVIRWALRTPLAIRLFAELYKSQNVDYKAHAFTLQALIGRKLDAVETALRGLAQPAWDADLQPVRRTLLGLVSAYVERGGPLSDEEATTAALSLQSGFGSIDTKTTSWILEKLRDFGLLLVSVSQSLGITPAVRAWEPAFEALTDYLVANSTIECWWSRRSA